MCSAYQRGKTALDKLQDTLRSFRTGKLDYGTAHAQFTAAGWDAGDADALLHNLNYAPLGDKADQFIHDQNARRKQQTNPLMQK
jgi:hypothetical protein